MKDLNLVPKSYIEKKKRKREIIYFTIIGIVIVGVFFTIVFLPLRTKRNLESRIKTLEFQIDSTKKYLQVEEEFNILKKIYNNRVEDANKIINIGINYIDIINSIERSMPEKLFVVNFSTNTGSKSETVISLMGICEGYDDIASFIRSLKKDELFSDVYLTKVNRANNQRGMQSGEHNESHYSFNMDISISTIGTSVKQLE